MSGQSDSPRTARGVGSGDVAWGPRILGPAALIVVLLALFVVITTSTGNGERGADATPSQKAKKKKGKGGADKPKTYVVEPGDTLSAIAAEFNVSTKRLLRLNPGIDPQALATGVELKIR